MAQLSLAMRALVQPHLVDIEPYDPNFTETHINLSANENTYPLPAGVREAVDAALAATPLNRYPDPLSSELRQELAAWHGVAPEQICVGNGGDELLFNIMFAFGGEERAVVTCPPDFSEYAFFASLVKTPVTVVARDPNTYALQMPELRAAAAHANLVVVTSPNNPTGDLVPLDEIERLCNVCPGIVLVDEAYGEFADEGTSAVPLLSRHPNLIVLKTTSKAFGAAGIRCGYVLAARDVIEVLSAVRQIYSVNVLTQAAALAMVRHRALYKPIIEQVRAERARMFAALGTLLSSITPAGAVWPSQGNFLLVRIPEASRVRMRLRDEFSILVRDFSAAPGLFDCLRITVGTPAENDEVLSALTAILKEDAS